MLGKVLLRCLASSQNPMTLNCEPLEHVSLSMSPSIANCNSALIFFIVFYLSQASEAPCLDAT